MKKYLPNIGKNAHKAFACKINTKIKNKVLYRFAKLIKNNKAKIKDPVDITLDKWKRPNGLLIK